MIRGFRDFVGYIDERVQCYPFMNEMTGLYKGLIEIWDEAEPDDLSPLFYISDETLMSLRLTKDDENSLSLRERVRVRVGLFSDETISNGFPLFNKNRIGDTDFSNSVRIAEKIIRIIEKWKREEATDIKDLSMKQIEDFIREGLYRDERYKNVVLKWILKPSFLYTLSRVKIDTSSWEDGRCPVCYSPPYMAIVDKVIAETEDIVKKELTGRTQLRCLSCCFCGYRWLYHLTGCPACGNNKPGKLGFFSDGSDCEQGTRAISCEECKTYIKTVFINCRTDGRGREELDMDIEDVVTIPLDMVAHQRGYLAICQK